MNLLTGEYNNALDDKGRLSFPSKLRTALNQNVVVITKGLNRCLWLFTAEEWDQFSSRLMENASMMKEQNMMVIRHFIAPAQEVEFDKTGRLSIPQSLRAYANLTKESTVLGMAKYVEIWDSATYNDYVAQCEEQTFRQAAENFNDISF